jgi:hypothetical protein
MSPVIRLVEVELLRRGPRHNQLLSPLTDYLAVCADFPGGVVNVPYEQSDAQNLLDDLRYTVASSENADRLGTVRDRAGAQLATMLEAIPGLGGVLATDHGDAVSLTHLRMVTSAAELALLPFELSKGPVGSGGIGDDWLLLQPDRPVCLTRHVRGVMRAASWPLQPRILFISGHDVPLDAHLDVFERVLEPYRSDQLRPVEGLARHWTSQHLTVIEEATLDEVRTAAAAGFTHVHVLAHGAELELRRTSRYGLALGDRIVTGAELALALASSIDDGRHLPSVVTLASCDSAAQGSVTSPGGSVAHDLHASGIPLVVGSQFPISEQASIPFTETFYRGQLAGEHPLVSITDVRRELATEFSDEHAWASVVVYEALPTNFDEKLEELCYWQSRRAHDIALARLERVATSDVERMEQHRDTGHALPDDFVSPTPEDFDALVDAVIAAGERLPSTGLYGAECDGLRAAGAKRLAEVAYWLSLAPDVTADRRDELTSRCVSELENALDLYLSTVGSLLSTSDGRANRKVTMHWIAGQVLIMQAVLGAPVDADLAGLARAAAGFDLIQSDPQVRGWATVSLIEQALLELATHRPVAHTSERAVELARDLMRVLGEDSEHVVATCRQMRRFAAWWGDPDFVAVEQRYGVERAIPWDAEHGVVATATAVITALTPPRHAVAARRRRIDTEPPRSRPPRAMATSPAASPPGSVSPTEAAPEVRSGTFDIELLPARNGDCIWLTYGEPDDLHHVMFDCGSVEVAAVARERVLSVPRVELFVLTHIDADHISGAVPLFTDDEVCDRIDDVWFNGWDQLRGFLSVAQGEAFSDLLARPDRKFRWNHTERGGTIPPIVTDGVSHPEVVLEGGLKLTVLSPTPSGLQRLAANWRAALAELNPQKAMLGRRARPSPPPDPSQLDLAKLDADGPTKDSSIPNLSSIAVLAEFGGRAVLLTGDAHADVLAGSIRALQEQRGKAGERLRLDALKLAHHGSANATTNDLLDTIDCAHHLVTSDGSFFYHPDRAAIARVVLRGGPQPTIHFNYRTDLNEFWENSDLQSRYGYATEYPDGGEGLALSL